MAISKIETDSLASGLVAPTATALTTASGSAPSYSARAWVNFNGTGTVAIRASGNVSSITDNGTGDYTVNFTTAFVDTNYNVVMFNNASGINPPTAGNFSNQYVGGIGEFATGSVRVSSYSAAFTDSSLFCVTVFR